MLPTCGTSTLSLSPTCSQGTSKPSTAQACWVGGEGNGRVRHGMQARGWVVVERLLVVP
jgi:hypothetical protein